MRDERRDEVLAVAREQGNKGEEMRARLGRGKRGDGGV